MGVCLDHGNYAIVMEYVENGDLEEMLMSETGEHREVIGQWSCRLKMSLEIAKGMNFLHSLNPPVIHRDLKTSNVLVDHNYSCKVSIHERLCCAESSLSLLTDYRLWIVNNKRNF